MIQTTIGNNLNKNTYSLTPDTTLRAAFEMAGVDYGRGFATLDGSSLGPGDINKSFAELGYDGTPGHDRAMLISVVKADNA